MNYYNFHIGDYKSHTDHLEPLEDLAYRRMIDWCYLHEKELPESVDEIARLIRMRTHNESIAFVLQEFFERTANGYANYRVMQEIEKYQEKSLKAKKSAEARWKNKPSKIKSSRDANALQTECEGNANQEPITNNQNKYSDDSYEVARYLANKIKSEQPNAKVNPHAWAKDIDKAIRIDKRTKEDLIGCINYIYQENRFWVSNIRSGKKLREKYDTIEAQKLNTPNQQKNQMQSNQSLDDVCDDFLNELMSQPSDPTYLYGGRR
jgi:uncharacterized protein YdaU (DUF1376 family)